MKALRYLEPGSVKVDDLPRPEIGLNEVLVEVRACGVCATDVKTFRRGHPLIPSGSVLGHEVSGTIAAVGDQVSGWQIGTAVAVAPYSPCGECIYCQRGQFTLCDHLHEAGIDPGGFSEFIRVPQRLVEKGMLEIPNGVTFAEAALTEPVACCFHGLEALNIKSGDSLLIIGDGPMGILQAELAQFLGAEPILMSGITSHRLARGSLIADVTIDISQEDLQGVVQRITGGNGVDKIIVSVGDASVAETALPLVVRGGAINLFAGMPRNARVSLDPARIHYDQVHLLGTFGFAPSHFRQALDAIAVHDVNVDGIITDVVPLEAVHATLSAAAEYEGIKTVVQI